MKEVNAELNLTAIVLISIGVLMTFFFTFLWPAINGDLEKNTMCKKATCDCSEQIVKKNNNNCECYIKKNGQISQKFNCVYKG